MSHNDVPKGSDPGAGDTKRGPGSRRATSRKGAVHNHKYTIARLSQPEFRERAQLTEDEMAVLDLISKGRPPRNAASILRAIEFRASYAYSKPKQEIEQTGNVTYNVVTGIDQSPGSNPQDDSDDAPGGTD